MASIEIAALLKKLICLSRATGSGQDVDRVVPDAQKDVRILGKVLGAFEKGHSLVEIPSDGENVRSIDNCQGELLVRPEGIEEILGPIEESQRGVELAKIPAKRRFQAVDPRCQVRIGATPALDLAGPCKPLGGSLEAARDAKGVSLHRKGVSPKIRERRRATARAPVQLCHDQAGQPCQLNRHSRRMTDCLFATLEGVGRQRIGLISGI